MKFRHVVALNSLVVLILLVMSAQQQPAPPVTIESHCGMSAKRVTWQGKQVSDWNVHCTAEASDGRKWEGDLPLAHPATWKEAAEAVDYFLTKGASQKINKETKREQ